MGLSRFLRRGRWDDERAKELDAYLAQEIDDNLARGMTPEAAAKAAHRTLGNATRIREEIYRMNTLPYVETFWQDLRYGLRLLARNRTFAVVAILTLALGTGANAAIFQLVNAVRMRALPVERSHELVSIGIETRGAGKTGRFMSRRPLFTEALWQTSRSRQQAFSHLLAWGVASWNVATDGQYQPVQGLYVSGGFYEALGVRAHVGRVLTEADDQNGCGAPGAVLTHGFWRSRYGGNAAAVGQTIVLDNRPFEIVGVTPSAFFGVEVGRTFDVALPICAEPLFRGEDSALGKPDHWFLDMMGRLAPGWTEDRAAAHLAAISPGIFQATLPPRYDAKTAEAYRAFTLVTAPAGTGVSGLRRAYQRQLWVLLAATGLVLLITCANLANLMLARATAREREMAVRLAIGASRRRLVRQMLSESLLIAGFGALGGALLARWMSAALVAFLSTENNRLFLDLTPDWRVFAFIAAVAVVACLLFGLSPALKATGTDPGKAMQAGGRSATDSHERFALRRALVVVQVALSMVLIVGALLFGRSLRNIVTIDPGFRQDGLVAVNVDIRRSAVDESARARTYERVMEVIRGLPGVQHAAEAFIVPMSGSGWNQNVVIDGQLRDGIVNFNRVGVDYFRALETTLIAGRPFGPLDRLGAPETAIVNESFARQYFGGANPVGRTFQIAPGEPRPQYQIVGYVKDTKYTDLKEPFKPIGYFPAAQETRVSPYLDLIVRSDLSLTSITPAVTRSVREVVPNATVAFETVRAYVRDSLAIERLMASLSMFFGLLALLIASIGLYGVMSYQVTRRQVEIGIRMALGADPAAVVRMVLTESGLLLIVGVLAGLGLAVAAARYAGGLLFGLEPSDPLSFATAAGVLALVSLIAAWIPARRASRLAPTVALRE
jgi:putative ABC transport system permease protein